MEQHLKGFMIDVWVAEDLHSKDESYNVKECGILKEIVVTLVLLIIILIKFLLIYSLNNHKDLHKLQLLQTINRIYWATTSPSNILMGLFTASSSPVPPK